MAFPYSFNIDLASKHVNHQIEREIRKQAPSLIFPDFPHTSTPKRQGTRVRYDAEDEDERYYNPRDVQENAIREEIEKAQHYYKSELKRRKKEGNPKKRRVQPPRRAAVLRTPNRRRPLQRERRAIAHLTSVKPKSWEL